MSFAISSFSPSHRLDSRLLTLMKSIHPLLDLLEVLGNIVEGENVPRWSIGAKEASDHLWVLIISSTPYPLKSTGNSVSEYINSREWLRNTSPLQEERLATGSVSAGALSPSPAGSDCPSRRDSGHRHLAELHTCTRNMAAREQELKSFWFGPTSLVISLHGGKRVP